MTRQLGLRERVLFPRRYKGFHVEGGTEGVGRATTQTVAVASVAVLLADFFLTKLLLTIT